MKNSKSKKRVFLGAIGLKLEWFLVISFCLHSLASTAHADSFDKNLSRGQVPVKRAERFTKNSVYFWSWCGAFGWIDENRKRAGNPPLAEDDALGRAAYEIANEMTRQDWAGLPLPDGRSLADFLRKVRYKGAPEKVHAYVWVSDDQGYHFWTMDKSRRLPAAMRWVAGIRAKGFGYCEASADNPAGLRINDRVREFIVPAGGVDPVTGRFNQWIQYGHSIEVILISEEAPSRPDRTVRPSRDQARYEKSSRQTSIAIHLKRGQRVKQGFAGGGAKIVGRMKRLRGRLPKGVRLNAKTGALLGIPRSKGSFLVTVRARYRRTSESLLVQKDIPTIHGAAAHEWRTTEVMNGVHTNTYRIFVR